MKITEIKKSYWTRPVFAESEYVVWINKIDHVK